MRNLKLVEASGVAKVPLDPSALTWDAPKAMCELTKENFARTARMMEVPGYSALTADAHAQIQYQLSKGPLVTDERVDAGMALMLGGAPGGRTLEQVREALTGLTANLNTFIEKSGNIHPMFESFLNSILIQAWTGMEVLMRHLLKRSLELHRAHFKHLADDQAIKLRDSSYQKLFRIREAYSQAFNGSPDVLNPINEICVDTLSEVRNLMIHHAGKVDHDFVTRCKDKGITGWAELEVGKDFPIDGSIVRSQLDANFKCANKLLRAVDTWLTDNQ